MYGMNIHKAVVEAKEKETGITIHLIDEIYDNGEVIFQTSCSVEPDDTPEIVAKKISLLEQTYFPKVVEEYILSGNRYTLFPVSILFLILALIISKPSPYTPITLETVKKAL